MLLVSTAFHQCLPWLQRRLRWPSLQTRGGFVLLVYGLFAAGPCQLWKAENHARLGALLGFTGSTLMVSRPASPVPQATPVPGPSFMSGMSESASPRPPAPQATRPVPALAAPLGVKPLTSRAHLAALLLDYAFSATPVAVVQVLRFPWEVVLTAPERFQVHRVADPADGSPSASVRVLTVRAQGPYVAVWMPDPGVLMEPRGGPARLAV